MPQEVKVCYAQILCALYTDLTGVAPASSPAATTATPQQAAHDRGFSPTDSIDCLASALLDVSSPARNSTVTKSPPTCNLKRLAYHSRTDTKLDDDGPFDLPLLSPSRGRNDSGGTVRRSASRVEKSSPKASNGGLRRAVSLRSSKSSKGSRGLGLHRPLSSNKAGPLNPLGLHPTTEYNSPNSLRSSPRPASTRGLLADRKNHILRPSSAEPSEINRQVNAMLAATDALKPTASTPDTGLRRTPKTGTSKVLVKMSHAWDRLHARSPVQQVVGQGEFLAI